MVKMFAVLGNSQMLDGGAMFGHVPKSMWSQWVTPDEHNRIPLACRALLIQEDDRNILLETGIGAFFSPKLRERYGVVESQHQLLESLRELGVSHEDIDIVVLSHLHFDHAGGLLSEWREGKELELLFPNAQYIVSKTAWERSNDPHTRDKASFIPELNKFLEKSGRLHIVEESRSEVLGDHYSFFYSNGHTPGLLHTIIEYDNQAPIVFASDLIPGSHWVHLPVTMGYDRAPELVINEKRALLDFIAEKDARVFYTHDPKVVMSEVRADEGKYWPVKMILSHEHVLEL